MLVKKYYTGIIFIFSCLQFFAKTFYVGWIKLVEVFQYAIIRWIGVLIIYDVALITTQSVAIVYWVHGWLVA